MSEPCTACHAVPVQYGTAEALEGGIRRASRHKNKDTAAGGSPSSENQGGGWDASPAATTAVALEAAELLREAAALVDTIASEHVSISLPLSGFDVVHLL